MKIAYRKSLSPSNIQCGNSKLFKGIETQWLIRIYTLFLAKLKRLKNSSYIDVYVIITLCRDDGASIGFFTTTKHSTACRPLYGILSRVFKKTWHRYRYDLLTGYKCHLFLFGNHTCSIPRAWVTK